MSSVLTELKTLVLYVGYREGFVFRDSDASIWSPSLGSIDDLFIMGCQSGCLKGQDQFAA
jgi:hypothetical protein